MTNDAHPADEVEAAEHTEIQHPPVEVGLQRSVRYGRIIVGGAILGAIIGLVVSLLFPVAEGANYELRQAAGVALVFGGVIGLTLGAILSLVLGFIASRSKGAAIAVQTDVR